MSLRVIGVNHHLASLEVREQFAFSPAQAADALAAWQDSMTDLEAVLLSTCNRTEFYVASESTELPACEHLLKFLLQQKSNSVFDTTLASQIFTLDGIEAAEHLFSVTSSLDSMVLGEVQILSQVKSAYQIALDAETVGPITHSLFQSALRTAKRVVSETAIHRHRVSVPSIAVVDFALQIFEKLDDKKILLFGAGEMGEETLRYLVEYGAKSVTILNRRRERAETLAKQYRGNVADWESRFELMTDADIIVSATGSLEPIVTLQDFRSIESRRQGRTLFVLDLAVPRDFEAAVGKCSGVYLYSIDDLHETCSKNRSERDLEIPKAEKIVKQVAKEFVKDMNHRRSGEVIQKLRERWTKTKDAELQRLFNKLPELSEKEESEISYAFDRLLGKFLHPPLESLRDESEHGEPHKLLEALARLFRLG
jgi:glutamyl-tRNA reductase